MMCTKSGQCSYDCSGHYLHPIGLLLDIFSIWRNKSRDTVSLRMPNTFKETPAAVSLGILQRIYGIKSIVWYWYRISCYHVALCDYDICEDDFQLKTVKPKLWTSSYLDSLHFESGSGSTILAEPGSGFRFISWFSPRLFYGQNSKNLKLKN